MTLTTKHKAWSHDAKALIMVAFTGLFSNGQGLLHMAHRALFTHAGSGTINPVIMNRGEICRHAPEGSCHWISQQVFLLFLAGLNREFQ